MTHPLVTMLVSIARKEAAMGDERKRFEANNALNAFWWQPAAFEADRMADERNDRREGYCDGTAGKWQEGRSPVYTEAQQDGAFDRAMLAMHYEFKRRAALTPASA